MYKWNSIFELFSYLNKKNIKYVVLRNFEELEEDDFLLNHADIDFLCEDLKQFVEAIHADFRYSKKDIVHYTVDVSGVSVPIDIRVVGDDYYDDKWEENILKCRELYKDICYIPNCKDYFYTLCYHAVLQKNELSSEYRRKLFLLDHNTDGFQEKDYVKMLTEFMVRNNYFFCYPIDRGVIFRKQLVASRLIKWNRKEVFYRNKISFINRVKRILCFSRR